MDDCCLFPSVPMLYWGGIRAIRLGTQLTWRRPLERERERERERGGWWGGSGRGRIWTAGIYGASSFTWLNDGHRFNSLGHLSILHVVDPSFPPEVRRWMCVVWRKCCLIGCIGCWELSCTCGDWLLELGWVFSVCPDPVNRMCYYVFWMVIMDCVLP